MLARLRHPNLLLVSGPETHIAYRLGAAYRSVTSCSTSCLLVACSLVRSCAWCSVHRSWVFLLFHTSPLPRSYPFPTQFMGYTLTPEPSIVTEFMARGSLFHILRQAGNRPPELRLQRAVALSVARGMAYLHSRAPPILHLDLKSPNVLVDDRWRIKIAGGGEAQNVTALAAALWRHFCPTQILPAVLYNPEA